jgi:NO-binding membrane sensor protein with MHYT domain
MTEDGEGVHVKLNLKYLFLSFLMAFLGSYSAVTLAELYRVVCRIRPKIIGPEATLFLMAVSIGMGAIWSMHFVGMNAITLSYQNIPLKTDFNIFLTIISLLAAIICVYLGLFLSSRDQMFTMNKEEFIQLILNEVKTFQSLRDKKILFKLILLRNPLPLIVGGSIMGSGVLVMHYIGMMAVSTKAVIHWNVGIVAASVVFAVVASMAAYWILFRLLALYPAMESLRVGSACVLTIAVCAVHYIGMAAASYSYDSDITNPSSSSSLVATVDQETIVQVVILFSLIYNYVISMIVQAELRSCHYRLSALDQILSTTTHLKSGDFLEEYHKWRLSYWKPMQSVAVAENYYFGFLKHFGRYPVISPVLDPDLGSPATYQSSGACIKQEQPQQHQEECVQNENV